MLMHAAVVLASLSGVLTAGNVPKCDSAITSKMSELYPQGIPNNIIGSIQKNGQYSYIVVSKDEAKFMGMNVKCIGISMPEGNKAKVSYKLTSLPLGFARWPTFRIAFPVKEENGILIQTDAQDYKLYVLYFSDSGVILTYRCCEDCTSTTPNVGIAVADKLKDSADTEASLAAAKAKLQELGLNNDIADIPFCS